MVLSKNIELRIVNEKNETLKPKEIGELLVRGPNVMQGYYKHPEASQEVLKDSWLYTGDMAKIEDDGYV